MLSRLFTRSLSLHLKTLTLISSSPSSSSSLSSLLSSNPISPKPSLLLQSIRPFSSSKGNGGGGDGSWILEPDSSISSVFGGEEERTLAGIVEKSEVPLEPTRSEVKAADPWAEEEKGDIFEGIDKEMLRKVGGGDEEWETAEGYEPWSLGGDDDGEKGDVFGIGDEGVGGIEGFEGIDGGQEKIEEMMELERKEQELLATLKVADMQVAKRDIVALARGGYADILCIQQSRKAEGERMKNWAEAAWKNRRLSLAQALEFSEPSQAAVIDTRICRVL